jgi:hypothetical protein
MNEHLVEHLVVEALSEHRRYTTTLLEDLDAMTSAIPREAATGDLVTLSSLTDNLRITDCQLARLVARLSEILSPVPAEPLSYQLEETQPCSCDSIRSVNSTT